MIENNKKGFTLIELLIVIAIIGMLASIVLVSLAGGREKAMEAKYISYVSAVTTLVEGAVAAGDFDSALSMRGCLGMYVGNKCWGNSSYWNRNDPRIAAALSGVGSFGEGTPNPYFNTYGVAFYYSPTNDFVRIYVHTGSGHTDMCDKFGWRNLHKASTYCRGYFYLN